MAYWLASLAPLRAPWSRKEVRTVPAEPAESVRRVCLSSDLRGVMLVGRRNVPGLVVVDLGSGESVRQWNKENPDQRIEAGNAILEVNGISKPQKMKEELLKVQTVEMLVKAELSTEQELVFREALSLMRRHQAVDELLEMAHAIEPDICSICQEDMCSTKCCKAEAAKEPIAKLPCGHHFHRSCVKKWLVSGKPRCPLCNCDFARIVCCEEQSGSRSQ